LGGVVYDEEDDLDELETQSVQSSSRMTARQVALATGLGAEHVQLRASNYCAQYTVAEVNLIALRLLQLLLERKKS